MGSLTGSFDPTTEDDMPLEWSPTLEEARGITQLAKTITDAISHQSANGAHSAVCREHMLLAMTSFMPPDSELVFKSEMERAAFLAGAEEFYSYMMSVCGPAFVVTALAQESPARPVFPLNVKFAEFTMPSAWDLLGLSFCVGVIVAVVLTR